MTLETTWSQSYTYRARRVHRPTDLDHAAELIAATPRIRALGSRHSFNDLADSPGDLIDLSGLPSSIDIDVRQQTVRVSAGTTYGELAAALHARGFALHAMASLPHISVGGAIATGTHGSGDRARSLAGAVTGLDLLDAEGQARQVRQGSADFEGMVVGLGALGVVTGVRMEIEPTYEVRQYVYNDVPWDRITAEFEDLSTSGASISLFTRWRPDVLDSLWIKLRDGHSPPADLERYAASSDQHPVRRLDASACTVQRGLPGPWHERLPHFRMGFTPSSGREIQVEYVLDRAHAAPALAAAATLREQLAPVLQISEMRTVAADELWLSPAYGRPSVSLHFTFDLVPEAVRALLPRIDAVLAPFEARPHWAKWFHTDVERLAALYPRLPDFRTLTRRMDPTGCFGNDFLDTWVLGGGTGGH